MLRYFTTRSITCQSVLLRYEAPPEQPRTAHVSVTSADVARHAGVSRATVSQILNGQTDRFAAATAANVLASAKELGYEPSAVGRALRRGSSDFVIAMLPHTTFGTNLQDLFEEMDSQLEEHGLYLVMRMSTSPTQTLDKVVGSLKPAAIFSLAPFTVEERAMLDSRGILAIDPPSASMTDFNREIGILQARTLLSRGHRRIGFVHLKDAREDPFGQAREDGVRRIVHDAGLDEIVVTHTDIDLMSAVRALREVNPPGIALACYNDDVAMAILAAARAEGLDVPGDVAVIGMDHTPLSRVTAPALTTIEYDLREAARQGTAGLLAALRAGAPVNRPTPAALSVVWGETA